MANTVVFSDYISIFPSMNITQPHKIFMIFLENVLSNERNAKRKMEKRIRNKLLSALIMLLLLVWRQIGMVDLQKVQLELLFQLEILPAADHLTNFISNQQIVHFELMYEFRSFIFPLLGLYLFLHLIK